MNTDYLAQAQVVVFTTRSNPPVTNIMHTKVEDATSHPPMAAVHGPVSAYDSTASYVEVVASPVAVETRSMYVVIPSNAGPGSVLTVVAPNGAKLTVRLYFTNLFYPFLNPIISLLPSFRWYALLILIPVVKYW